MCKRILNISFVILLVISLVACTGTPKNEKTSDTTTTENTSDTTTGTKTSDTTTDTTTETKTVDWREPYKEPVQVRIALNESASPIFPEGEDWGNNLWTKKWKEDYNIEVIVDWVSSDYDTKLNLAIASGSIPDAFHCSAVQLHQLAQAGQIQDLKDVYEKYASPGLRKMMENNWDIVETGMFNGELLALPRLHYGYETLTSFMWARKDWMEGLGITELKTIEDLENLMGNFMTQYSADYGIMLNKDLRPFFQMSAAFHAYPTIWVEGPDGSIVYGATLPEMKNALAKWAEWYKKGYIREDFPTLDNAAMFQDAYNGKVGLFAEQNWASWYGEDMVNNLGPDTYFLPYNLPSVDGQKVYYPVAFPNIGYNVVRKGYEHPEVLLKLINSYVYILDESVIDGSMSIDDVLPFNTNNMHHITGPFKVEFETYNNIKEVQHALKTGEEKFTSGNAYLFYSEIKKWVDNKELIGLGRYVQMGYEKGSLVLALDHVDNNQILKSKLWGAPPQAVIDYGSTLNDLLIEGYTKIIMGVEDISYYDTLIEEWRKAGGDQVTAAVNEMYGNK